MLDKELASMIKAKPLRELVQESIEQYLESLEGSIPSGVYQMVIKEIEIGLFSAMMRHAKGNQSQACKHLGLARGTLRRRLEEYGIE